MQDSLKCLDVREDLRRGEEPFAKIMGFVEGLAPQESWQLLATFRPDPLIAVMAARGYQAEPEALPDGSWQVTFTKTSG